LKIFSTCIIVCYIHYIARFNSKHDCLSVTKADAAEHWRMLCSYSLTLALWPWYLTLT